MQLLEDEPELAESLGEVPVAVIEKGKVAGAHLLSGANMRPSAMRELFPDLDPSDWPVYEEVTKDAVYLLTSKLAVPLKPPPPNFRNHGNYVTSIAKLGRFLGEKAEEAGVYLLTETAADKLLVSDRIVRGRALGRQGPRPRRRGAPNFEPGSDVVAKATVLAEGTQGHLTGAAIDYFELQGLQPQRWELGVKEVWTVPKPLDRVIHTMGWPLRKSPRYNEFGGSFIYPMGEDKVCIGLVVGLDYTDATFSVHDALQELKTHPFVRNILEGGERVAWGAKTIPSGGYWALPRKFAVPGMVMCGDNAGMCNVSELKGIHYAMHAGMYAAEAIVDALKRDSVNFDAYDQRVRDSDDRRGPLPVAQRPAVVLQGLLLRRRGREHGALSGGRCRPGRWKQHEDSKEEMELGKAADGYPKPDNKYTFDKLSSVFASGNATRDDAPNHIRVQREVAREVAQAWVSMCPAQVYEIPEDQLANGAATVDLNITPSNCVQCGAITAKGGRLTPPEGGDGPLYQET